MNPSVFRRLIVICAMVVLPVTGYAQEAMVSGTVSDSTGGVLPGVTITMTIIIVLPFTFGLDPLAGLAAMIGVYVGGESGGLVTSSLLGIPGKPSAVATTFDGFPMARRGEPGRAIWLGTWASFIGGLLGAFFLVGATVPLAAVNFTILRFGSAYGWGAGSNLIQTFLDAGLRGESPEVWGVGLRLNQYTHVNDIARGAVAALPSDNEIFNLISPEETSTGEIALMLREIFGFEVTFLRDKPEGKSMPYMSPRKAIRHLGWRPTPLVEGIKALETQLLAASSKGGARA